MAIKDILKMYATPGSTTTEDGRMLALSLAEIQTELMALREQMNKSAPIPTTATATPLDTSGIEAAISKLTPLPPQDLNLNPVIRSYEETQRTIKELLGEIKTTNHRMTAIRGGGGGGGGADPKHLVDIKRKINDSETRMDYGSRSDTNPIYIGRAEARTPTTELWSIQFLTYDPSNRVIRIQHNLGPWDSRASLNWS